MKKYDLIVIYKTPNNIANNGTEFARVVYPNLEIDEVQTQMRELSVNLYNVVEAQDCLNVEIKGVPKMVDDAA